MSTSTLQFPERAVGVQRPIDISAATWKVLTVLGSLKITVWAFFLAIILLLVGTLAQDEETIPDVKRDYFNSWIAKVPLDVFAPITIFPLDSRQRIPYVVPLPGGAAIGIVLLINLIAAKITRFKMTARDGRLISGIAFCLVGATITAVVILGAHAQDGLQGEPPSYDILWAVVKGSIFIISLGLIFAPLAIKFKTRVGLASVIIFAALFSAWSIAILAMPESLRISDSGLRIVWQMSKSLIAGTILLVGLILLFGRRGGNVLIHLSVGMMMLGQFIFGDRQIEERITLADGDSTNVAIRPDEFELAIIDRSNPDTDRVVAIDVSVLKKALNSKKPIDEKSLPITITVDQYIDNATLASLKDNKNSVPPLTATAGVGKEVFATESAKVGGATESSNIPAAYVTFKGKNGSNYKETYLLSLQLNDRRELTVGTKQSVLEEATIDGKPFEVGLRFRRAYKDYRITLRDVERLNYGGSNTVRDFSSYVTIEDAKGSENVDGRIWMNNPMRYRGETFYQSSFYSSEMVGRDTTGLQVVSNAGWLLPYISCAFATLGMLSHFGTSFARFASRFDRERKQHGATAMKAADVDRLATNRSTLKASSASNLTTAPTSTSALTSTNTPELVDENMWSAAERARHGIAAWLLPTIVVVVVGVMFYSSSMIRSVPTDKIDWFQAGGLPAQHDGRIKPIDTVARNLLQAMSGQTSVVLDADDSGQVGPERTMKAIEWFYGVIADKPWIDHAYMFRIDAKEVLDAFDLRVEDSRSYVNPMMKMVGREGRHRYSWAQLQPNIPKFMEKLEPIIRKREENEKSLRFEDQKFLELFDKISLFRMLSEAYSTSSIADIANVTENRAPREEVQQKLMAELNAIRSIEVRNPPAMVPLHENVLSDNKSKDKLAWKPLRSAIFAELAAKFLDMKQEHSDVAWSLLQLRESLVKNDVASINSEVSKLKSLYRSELTENVVAKSEFENWYNSFGPLTGCIAFYIIAFALALLSFFVLPQSLRRVAFWITVVVFTMHVFGIAARIYITGRAPVINLYSSAVFIGCGAVLFGLVLEMLFPIRIGILVGTAIGSTSLLVAYGLDTSDTMHVLQAVLDTQFWLTTHVQCITAGYLASFFAGFLAICAIIHRSLKMRSLYGKPENSASSIEAHDMQRLLMRMTYGTVCFATFFSLIGTVLGGLWADDSWGRFWGWDPKENGALMIVIWNAILLHARWDKLVGERGFALLAIGGNIVTAWSWFGTNQLGIGLHSYGFTTGVLVTLATFVASQLLIIVVGAICTSPQLRLSIPPDTTIKPSASVPSGSWD